MRGVARIAGLAGSSEANSVVTVLPSTMPPARRTSMTMRGVGLRPVAGIDRRAVGGREIGGVEDVLDADGKPAQRRARELRLLGVAAARASISSAAKAPIRPRLRRSPRRRDRPPRAGEFAGLDPARKVERESISAAVDQRDDPLGQAARGRHDEKGGGRGDRPGDEIGFDPLAQKIRLASRD